MAMIRGPQAEWQRPLSTDDNYSLWMGMEVGCQVLGIEPERMLEVAGLAHLPKTNGEVFGTARQFFDAWNALVSLVERPDFITDLGVTIARGPVIPVFFAFTCAPDLETGIRRLARYKSLLGPTQARAYRQDGRLWIEYHSADPDHDIPSLLAALHLVYSCEATRLATARPVQPLAARLNGSTADRHAIAAHLGVMPEAAEISAIAYALEDARRPFVSANARLWEDFEKDLDRQHESQRNIASMRARVRASLLALFATGRSSAADVCRDLGLSRSSLQRALRAEDTTFQAVLDDTREDLAKRYLTKSNLQVAEIASLLAYRDPNSFTRSFRRWTGMAPNALREGDAGSDEATSNLH